MSSEPSPAPSTVGPATEAAALAAPPASTPAAAAASATPARPAPSAVLAAAATKSGIVWAGADGRPAQSLWHVWHDGAVTVVVGGDEQRDPVGDSTAVRLTVPSKESGARLLSVDVEVEVVEPGDPRWVEVTTALAAQRLNARDATGQVEAWAQHSRVLRLVPTGEVAIGAEPEEAAGRVRVDAADVRARGWRPLRSRLLPRRR